MKTQNAISAEQNTLSKVDDFDITLDKPQRGKMVLHITLGELAPVTCDLWAASDDLQQLKEWMEAIARDESHASVALGSGVVLACELTDIPESTVETTYRYLDEQFPSPIALVSITTENGETRTAVLKVKHFINMLYVALLANWYDLNKRLKKDWYPYTKAYEESEDFRKWMRKHPYWHQSLLSSPLIEWYLQSAESYTQAKPQFKYDFGCVYMFTMWADFGGSIFWSFPGGGSVGDATSLEIGDFIFDLSDIEGLKEWYAEFHSLAYDYHEQEGDLPLIKSEPADEEKCRILRETKAWHLRGFKLAQEIRKRLPLNVIMIYEQSWDVAYGLHYFQRDKGRIIFAPAKLETRCQSLG